MIIESGSEGRVRTRRRRVAVALAAIVAFGLVCFAAGGLWQRAPSAGTSSAAAGAAAGECVADSGDKMRDIVGGADGKDYEGLWPHTRGQEITVQFASGGLPARYADFVKTGAQTWSRSPCVNAVAVEECSAGANCSTVTTTARADEEGTDGDSDSVDRRGVRRSNKLTLYTGLLDGASESGALATTVHEMGHALGLMHRKDKSSVMYADTIDMTNAVPDEIDYENLVVLYGGGRQPGE